jgi:site-specific DNA recombinase
VGWQPGGIQRKIASMIRAIEDGLYQPSMKERMAELEAEKAAFMERLASPEPASIRFHPNLAQQYRNKISNLEQVLANPATHPNTVASIRGQIERIKLTPNAEGGLDIHLYGDLARILQFCEAGDHESQRPGRGGPGREVSVVAGAGFEPATFRL